MQVEGRLVQLERVQEEHTAQIAHLTRATEERTSQFANLTGRVRATEERDEEAHEEAAIMQARLRLELSQVPTTLVSAPSQPRWLLPSTVFCRPPCRYPAAECCTILLAGARAQQGAAGADRRDARDEGAHGADRGG